jgi:hypothetical protein
MQRADKQPEDQETEQETEQERKRAKPMVRVSVSLARINGLEVAVDTRRNVFSIDPSTYGMLLGQTDTLLSRITPL